MEPYDTTQSLHDKALVAALSSGTIQAIERRQGPLNSLACRSIRGTRRNAALLLALNVTNNG